MKQTTLAELAVITGAEVRGDASYPVTGLATLRSATAEQVSFLANEKYTAQMESSQAGVIIMHPNADNGSARNALLSENPYLAYAKVAQFFDPVEDVPKGVHPTALIGENVRLGNNVSIGPYVVIEANVRVGDNTQVGAHCFLGAGVALGNNCRLWPRVTLYHDVQAGNDCVLHSGATIGADGFGWASENGKWVKIPQLGRVVLGDRVNIGAGTTIDRGALDDTVIGAGCIIDNLVQIGHNVVIGENTAIAGQVGIAGSTRIGKNCLLGGQAGFGGHLTIADNVQFHGQAMVTKSVEQAGVYASGNPIAPQGEWAKTGVRYRQLPELFKRVKALEKATNKDK